MRSYFVDLIYKKAPKQRSGENPYVKLPPGAQARSFYSFLAGLPAEESEAFLPARRMTTAAGFPRETMFLALLRGLVAQRLPIFFREHLLTVVTVLVLAALPARIFPRRRLLLPVRNSFSGFGKHWSFSLFPLSLPLPGKRAAAAQLRNPPQGCWRKRATISAAI